MRRLPVYFLLDTSGSMYGEPIQALNNALSGMINTLRSDAQALGPSRRECTRTWSSRGDRSRSSTGAGGCRIASVLLLRGCALTLRQPTGTQ